MSERNPDILKDATGDEWLGPWDMADWTQESAEKWIKSGFDLDTANAWYLSLSGSVRGARRSDILIGDGSADDLISFAITWRGRAETEEVPDAEWFRSTRFKKAYGNRVDLPRYRRDLLSDSVSEWMAEIGDPENEPKIWLRANAQNLASSYRDQTWLYPWSTRFEGWRTRFPTLGIERTLSLAEAGYTIDSFAKRLGVSFNHGKRSADVPLDEVDELIAEIGEGRLATLPGELEIQAEKLGVSQKVRLRISGVIEGMANGNPVLVQAIASSVSREMQKVKIQDRGKYRENAGIGIKESRIFEVTASAMERMQDEITGSFAVDEAMKKLGSPSPRYNTTARVNVAMAGHYLAEIAFGEGGSADMTPENLSVGRDVTSNNANESLRVQRARFLSTIISRDYGHGTMANMVDAIAAYKKESGSKNEDLDEFVELAAYVRDTGGDVDAAVAIWKLMM